MAEIHGLMVKVMRDLTEVGKDKQNAHFKFSYRGIDDAMNNLGDACRKHGVVTSWRTESETTVETPKGFLTTLRGTLTFHAADGSKVESAGYGVGVDAQDKGGNKAMAAAFKYATFMGLCIPVAAGVLDDADADGEPAPAKPARGPNKKQQAEGWPSKDEMQAMTVEELRALYVKAQDAGEAGICKAIKEVGDSKKGS